MGPAFEALCGMPISHRRGDHFRPGTWKLSLNGSAELKGVQDARAIISLVRARRLIPGRHSGRFTSATCRVRETSRSNAALASTRARAAPMQ